jgi:glycosyltransferase involved in cell wall biosynthesis
VSETPLLVFADDWGRHPSSCQHLVRRLLDRHPTYWVNTIGTRKPRFDLATLRRGLEKVAHWWGRRRPPAALPANLHVLSPRMWPWFSTAFDRRLNRRLLGRALTALIQTLPEMPVAVTTLPIVADLVGVLPVRRWVYYCVDDFSQWPGLDGDALRKMEADLLRRVDTVVAVSETLRQKLAGLGWDAHLLTHGVDVEDWTRPVPEEIPALQGLERPLVVFWGVVDRRLDVDWVRSLCRAMPHGTLVLAGPQQDPDPALATIPRVVRLGSLPFEHLPRLAAEAAVLVMPYADLPVTRAMQPLKLKEYLATGRPVVVRDLPATHAWADCLDVASTPEAFAAAVRRRIEEGLPPAQREARGRLAGESWSEKARQFEGWVLGAGANGVATHRPAAEGRLLQAVRRKRAAPAANGRPAVVLDVRVVAGSGGGPDKTILNSPRFLEPAGYRNVCAYMAPPDDPGFEQIRHKAEAQQAPLLRLDDRGPLDWRVASALLQVCRRERVAIWHGHDYKSNLLGLLLRPFWPMRLVTTLHGWVHHTRRTPLYYAVDRLCLPRYERVLCVSPDLFEQARAGGVPAGRCLLVENGIDLAEFSRRRTVEEAKRRAGVPAGRLVVGAVGRLSAEKGFDVLIRAADRLLRGGLDLELWIAGAGDERDALQRQIDELGRGDRVRLLGYCADPADLYHAMDVFALSSRREGLPNVVLEAMALEVPVVATRVAGIPRLIRPDENGLLVQPEAEEELAGALGRLLADEALRRRLAACGRRTIEDRYSFAARMDRVRAVYDELLGRTSPAGSPPLSEVVA